MRDTFESVAITIFIVCVLALLGWHMRRADQAVERYEAMIGQALNLDRRAAR